MGHVRDAMVSHHCSCGKDTDDTLTALDTDLEPVDIHHSARSMNFLLTKLVRETADVAQKINHIHLINSPQVSASTLFVVVLQFNK